MPLLFILLGLGMLAAGAWVYFDGPGEMYDIDPDVYRPDYGEFPSYEEGQNMGPKTVIPSTLIADHKVGYYVGNGEKLVAAPEDADDATDQVYTQHALANMDEDELLEVAADIEEQEEIAREELEDYLDEEAERVRTLAEEKKAREANMEELVEQLHETFEYLDPRAALEVLNNLDAIEKWEDSGEVADKSPVLFYGQRRFVHFKPGTAYILSPPLQDIVANTSEISGMPTANVVAASLMFQNRWYHAIQEGRIRPLADAFGLPLGEYMIIDINKEVGPGHIQDKWRLTPEVEEVLDRAHRSDLKKLRLKHYNH